MRNSAGEVPAIPGIGELWKRTTGDDRIRVAVVDGPVDHDHPVFAGASLHEVGGVWPRENPAGGKTAHGTAVASILAAQHASPVAGVAPGCRLLSVPVFSDQRPKPSQVDLARGIELAVEAGAHVINISAGKLSPSGGADGTLASAIDLCHDNDVLVVAAAGNDGCFCDHVPAALPAVVAVGAMDRAGEPMRISNWGPGYRHHGILAPGEQITCACPGGGIARRTGTSMAAPIVSGVAALLLSLRVRAGLPARPRAVRTLLLESADPCPVGDPVACLRYLAGTLNIEGAVDAMTKHVEEQADTAVQVSCECAPEPAVEPPVETPAEPEAAGHALTPVSRALDAEPEHELVTSESVPPSGEPVSESWQRLVYAVGILGYDFGSEARRDSFKQLMPPTQGPGGLPIQANPYDVRQMVAYLKQNPSEASALIWTLNLELTPIYAVEPIGSYGPEVYRTLVSLLEAQADASSAADDEIDLMAGIVRALRDALSARHAAEQAHSDAAMSSSKQEVTRLAHTAAQQARNATDHLTSAFDRAKQAKYLTDNEVIEAVRRALEDSSTKLDKIDESLSKITGQTKIDDIKGYAEQSAATAYRVYHDASGPIVEAIKGRTGKRRVERVALPGRLGGQTVRLFSGQAIPAVTIDQVRGLVGWDVNTLVQPPVPDTASDEGDDLARLAGLSLDQEAAQNLRDFLNRIYFDMRNLGSTSADRALNFAATNAFLSRQIFVEENKKKRSMDKISVEKSPYGRMDSDSWDIKLRFFDPENTHRAYRVYRYTIDVSDVYPVTVGGVRSWSEA
ncbi:PatA/PatG family cyanobactin maturation protease [Amycolatopsis cihanbeyliensis]|uniref:Cyanobactin maturation PatA/PatG family protease n=1 Tax=Amycolatopsis cihanbeyliensis TaxID=1128664 RepID=A0A542CUX2_AMYCI|nr:PatA/PatG family cyanobactin maturation protease [Amycolatopsis cihanbeyliensis]TQI94614.1 cyanobactin maturation PatA/PatG family protease [Amycolatopsis cihanbeyliensis]